MVRCFKESIQAYKTTRAEKNSRADDVPALALKGDVSDIRLFPSPDLMLEAIENKHHAGAIPSF